MRSDLSNLRAFETERLRLRTLDEADAAAFRAMTDDPAITGAVHFLAAPFTLDDARRLLAGAGDGRDRFLGVWRREDDVFIGTVGTHLRGTTEIEVGYWLSGAAHGRGYGTEAVRAVVQALGVCCPDRTVYAECRPENVASWRLLERVGFAADGRNGLSEGRKRLVLRP